jgi:hypothetical protein
LTREWQNRADLELKNDENWDSPNRSAGDTCDGSYPLRLLSEVFSCQETKKPNKLKKTNTLHSPKRLGGLKPPLDEVQGDSKLHNPSGWETLASTRLTQGGTKSGRREETSLLRQPKLESFSPSFRRSPPCTHNERERERDGF